MSFIHFVIIDQIYFTNIMILPLYKTKIICAETRSSVWFQDLFADFGTLSLYSNPQF